jgi:hypothetical protein
MTVLSAPNTVIRIWLDSLAPSAVSAAPSTTWLRSSVLESDAVP